MARGFVGKDGSIMAAGILFHWLVDKETIKGQLWYRMFGGEDGAKFNVVWVPATKMLSLSVNYGVGIKLYCETQLEAEQTVDKFMKAYFFHVPLVHKIETYNLTEQK